MRPVSFASLVVLGLCAAMPARAQSIDSRNPAGVVAALVAAGQTAQLKAGAASGDPMIRAVNNQFEYSIHFAGCTANKNCTAILLNSAFTPPQKMTAAQLASWNAKSTFGKVSFSTKSGDPTLDHRVALTDGKKSTPLFIADLNRFREAMISLITLAMTK